MQYLAYMMNDGRLHESHTSCTAHMFSSRRWNAEINGCFEPGDVNKREKEGIEVWRYDEVGTIIAFIGSNIKEPEAFERYREFILESPIGKHLSADLDFCFGLETSKPFVMTMQIFPRAVDEEGVNWYKRLMDNRQPDDGVFMSMYRLFNKHYSYTDWFNTNHFQYYGILRKPGGVGKQIATLLDKDIGKWLDYLYEVDYPLCQENDYEYSTDSLVFKFLEEEYGYVPSRI